MILNLLLAGRISFRMNLLGLVEKNDEYSVFTISISDKSSSISWKNEVRNLNLRPDEGE